MKSTKLSDLDISRLLEAASEEPLPDPPACSSASLVFQNGSRAGQRVLLPNHGRIRVGRAPSCWVSLASDQDRVVSAQHAELSIAGDGRIELLDLDSANGTYVNSRRVKGSYLLEDRDVVEFGRQGVRAVYCAACAAPEDQTSQANKSGESGGEIVKNGALVIAVLLCCVGCSKPSTQENPDKKQPAQADGSRAGKVEEGKEPGGLPDESPRQSPAQVQAQEGRQGTLQSPAQAPRAEQAGQAPATSQAAQQSPAQDARQGVAQSPAQAAP